MSGNSSRFTAPKAGFRRRTCKRQHLSRAFETGCGPPRLKDVAWLKIHLFANSALAYNAKSTQRLLTEFRFLADRPPYSPNLNPLDFNTRCVFQAKAQATPHSNLTALVSPSPRNRTGKQRYVSVKHRFSLAKASMPTSTKNLWDSMWSPAAKGHSLTENTMAVAVYIS